MSTKRFQEMSWFGKNLHDIVRRELRLDNHLARLIKTTKNWYDPILSELGIKTNVIVRFRNGLQFKYVPQFFAVEMFLDEPYNMVDVRGRDVIDIGAWVGDSAIYFAMRGARSVRAFEPIPLSCAIAKENVRLNRCSNITIYNEGVSGQDSQILIRPELRAMTSSELATKDEGSPVGNLVHFRSLDTIVQEFDLKDAVLKIDCEGCEFEIVNSSDSKTLRVFSEIIMEYHDNPTQILIRLEKVGFNVSFPLSQSPFPLSPSAFPRSPSLLHAKRESRSLD